jgi:hypothetical protein
VCESQRSGEKTQIQGKNTCFSLDMWEKTNFSSTGVEFSVEFAFEIHPLSPHSHLGTKSTRKYSHDREKLKNSKTKKPKTKN